MPRVGLFSHSDSNAMTSSKLGIKLSSLVLTTAVGLAPVNGAWAAAPSPEGDPASEEIEIGGSEEDEGEALEVGSPDGEDAEAGEEIEIGGSEADEGEEIAVGDPEGEEIAVGDPEGEEEVAEEELPEAEEVVEEEVVEEEPDLTPVGPQRPAEPTWGPKNQYPRNGKGMLITGGVVTGLGAAFIATAILITRCDFDSSLACRYGDQRDFLLPSAIATTGLGLLLVGVGVGNRLKYKRWENWTPEQTAVVPTYVPGGGGVAWVGRF